LTDSALIARKLADFALVLCASPSFVQHHGKPQNPRDLTRFPAVVDTNFKGRNNWQMLDDDGREITVTVQPIFEVNSPEVAKRAALSGLGLTLVPGFSVEKELADGSLLALMPERFQLGSGIYAVYPHRRHVPAKVRAFVDFMSKWFRQHHEQKR
jgi:DNA-binding transcriptional LysR family regulator